MICDEVNCVNHMCTEAIKNTRNRRMKQISKFSKVTGMDLSRPCKDTECNNIVFHPKQLCDTCRDRNLIERKRRDRLKRRKVRVCKNIKCNNSLAGLGNSVKYCSDGCRPKKQATARTLREGERKPMKKQSKTFGINPKYTNPRGSKKRKELGLEEIKFSNDGYHRGYSVVE